MKVVIAGGTGFLGRPLSSALATAGHNVVVLTRDGTSSTGGRSVAWAADGATGPWAAELDGADAVVNLAGENLANGRWTPERKAELESSRILPTRSLVAAIRSIRNRPKVFVSGSAVGFYGATGDDALDESYPPGKDFLARLCVQWEAEAHAVSALGPRLVIIRTGVVLAGSGGALKKLRPQFKWFVGGRIASGRQFVSWIHRDDWVGLVRWAIENPSVSGMLNGTAPAPARNADFSRAIGRALHRPSWLPVPGLALKAIVGELADVALVHGQCVVPARAMAFGFQFQHPALDEAMRDALQSG